MLRHGDRKILRIGVICSGRVIEERLLRRLQTVTVGTSERSTITVDHPGLPARQVLFRPRRGGEYELTVLPGMKGRVTMREHSAVFEDDRSRRPGRARRIRLEPDARGKVHLGGTTLLFQYVTPPPMPVRPKLPSVARGGMVRSMDWVFATILVCSFIGHSGVVAVARNTPRPAPPTLEEVADRFVDLFMPDLPATPAPKPERIVEALAPETPVQTQVDEPEPLEPGPERGSAPTPRPRNREELREAVASAGILSILGHNKPGSAASAGLLDPFDRGLISGDLDQAFESVSRVTVASADSMWTRRGFERDAVRLVKLEGLRAGPARDSGDLGTRERARISGTITPGEPEVDPGSLDAAALRRLVRRRMAAIQACYERRLKRNANLSGRVMLLFVVGVDGRLLEAEIAENTTGDREIERCILKQIRGWRFPRPATGEEAEVSIPFVFVPQR